MPAPELPAALWAQVLQHVPLQQRLSRCALVCKAWAAAAAAATVDIKVQLFGDEKLAALQSWLHRHSGHLCSFKLARDAQACTIGLAAAPDMCAAAAAPQPQPQMCAATPDRLQALAALQPCHRQGQLLIPYYG